MDPERAADRLGRSSLLLPCGGLQGHLTHSDGLEPCSSQLALNPIRKTLLTAGERVQVAEDMPKKLLESAMVMSYWVTFSLVVTASSIPYR